MYKGIWRDEIITIHVRLVSLIVFNNVYYNAKVKKEYETCSKRGKRRGSAILLCTFCL